MRIFDRQSDRGFTLIEALLAAAVLAMAMTAVVMPFIAGAHNQQVEARRTLAVSLAEALMEEVLLRPFEEPDDDDDQAEDESVFGPEGGEVSREDFSAVDDFDGYTEAAGSIVGADGAIVDEPGSEGLSRNVSVDYVSVPGQLDPDDRSFMRVTVETRHQGEPLITLTRLVYWVKQPEEDD